MELSEEQADKEYKENESNQQANEENKENEPDQQSTEEIKDNEPDQQSTEEIKGSGPEQQTTEEYQTDESEQQSTEENKDNRPDQQSTEECKENLSDQQANEEYKETIKASGVWIDNDFLTEVLSSTYGQTVQVLSYEVNAAVGAGENYLSVLHRVNVTYKADEDPSEKNVTLMVKSLPLAEQLVQVLEGTGVFEKEKFFYKTGIPEFHRLLDEYFPEGTAHVAPDSFACPRPKTIIMEDLRETGFKMASRQDQLDRDHCVFALKTLARFHALSAKVFQLDPSIILNSTGEFYEEKTREGTEPYLETGYPALADVVEGWGEHAKYAEDIRLIGQNIFDKIVIATRKSEYLNVMNHGDAWVNNFMFKYNDEGGIETAKLIDFQISRFSSPVCDLHYFLVTSVRPEILKTEMFDLLKIYHETLLDDLGTLQVDVDYTFQRLEEEFKDRAIYAFVPLMQVLPMVLALPSNAAQMGDLNSGEYILTKHFRYIRYQEVCGSFLDNYEAIGYLEVAKNAPTELADAEKPLGKYQQMVEDSGKWIDNQFLMDLLSSELDRSVKLISYKVTAAVGAGDNYMSIIHRIHLTYKLEDSEENQEMALITKSYPTLDHMIGFVREMGLFSKEIFIYKELFPAMLTTLSTYFPDGTENVVPHSYRSPRENTIVLQDLVAMGYSMVCRQEQLDYEHCKVTLKALARFHALSVRLYQDDPSLIEGAIIPEFYSEEHRGEMQEFFEKTFPAMAQVMEEWGNEAKYAGDIRELGVDAYSKVVHMCKKSNEFNVLCHGDMWINNILYKHDENGEVESARLLDFQASRFSSPATDLHYLFFTSVRPHVLEHQMFDLIQFYHQSLMEDLETVQIPVDYSLEQLHEDLRDRSFLAIVAIAVILPLVIAPPTEMTELDIGVDADQEQEFSYVKHYRQSRYREAVGSLLELLDTVGYLREAKERTKDLDDNAQRAATAELDTFDDPVDMDELNKADTGNLSPFERFWRMLVKPICE